MSKKSEREELLAFLDTHLEDWRARTKSENDAFRDWAVEQVLWDLDISWEQIQQDVTSIEGPGDLGIDGWYYAKDSTPPIVYVIQSKNTKAKVDDLLKMRNGFESLFDSRTALSNRDAKARAIELKEDFVEGTEVEFHLVTSDLKTPALTENAARLSTPITVLERTLLTRVLVHDVSDLAQELRIIRSEEISADFTVPLDQCFRTEKPFGTVATAVSGLALASLFRKHRTNLFRLNPRYYLSTRGTVNKGMLDTLRSPDRENFYVYNNGVTAVCDGLSVEPNEKGGVTTIHAENFQIVNGCQTTATLHEAWVRGVTADDLANVQVMLRIVEAGASVTPLIRERTNSQNPMKAEDERSSDKRQDRLHREFSAMRPPWFYENKRGVWVTEYSRKADKTHFAKPDGGYRHITMKDLAQACLAFLGNPAGAIEGPRFVFQTPERYDQVFPEKVHASQLLLPYRIFEEAVDAIGHLDGMPGATYLRYPLVHAVSYIIHRWLDEPETQYLSTKASQELCEKASEWVPALIDFAAPVLVDVVQSSDLGPRATVRKKEWMDEPVRQILKELSRELDRDVQYAKLHDLNVEDWGIRAKFPLTIKKPS